MLKSCSVVIEIQSISNKFSFILGYPYPVYNVENREPVFDVVGRTIIALLAVRPLIFVYDCVPILVVINNWVEWKSSIHCANLILFLLGLQKFSVHFTENIWLTCFRDEKGYVYQITSKQIRRGILKSDFIFNEFHFWGWH